MCLAIPARVIELRGTDQAVVDLDGVQRLVSRELVEHVELGDYLIVHVGYALSRLDEAQAQRTLELLAHGGIELQNALTPDPSPASGTGEEQPPSPTSVGERSGVRA